MGTYGSVSPFVHRLSICIHYNYYDMWQNYSLAGILFIHTNKHPHTHTAQWWMCLHSLVFPVNQRLEEACSTPAWSWSLVRRTPLVPFPQRCPGWITASQAGWCVVCPKALPVDICSYNLCSVQWLSSWRKHWMLLLALVRTLWLDSILMSKVYLYRHPWTSTCSLITLHYASFMSLLRV